MNEFVNFQTRGIELPAGCKDLIDMLSPPEHVEKPVEGFAHIERYLSRLLRCAPKRGSITIWSSDYQNHVILSAKGSKPYMKVFFDGRDSRAEASLNLFRDAGIVPAQDFDGRVEGTPLRMLIFPLPSVVEEAADLIRAFFQKIYGLGVDAGLIFAYHERDALVI